jgi:hypothetical protein
VSAGLFHAVLLFVVVIYYSTTILT